MSMWKKVESDGMSEKFVNMREIEPKTLRVLLPEGARVIIHTGLQGTKWARMAIINTGDALHATSDDSVLYLAAIMGDDE